jgi:hypothetical protein
MSSDKTTFEIRVDQAKKINILKYTPIKLSNGKFGLWDDECKCFDSLIPGSLEEMNNRLVNKVEQAFVDQIKTVLNSKDRILMKLKRGQNEEF